MFGMGDLIYQDKVFETHFEVVKQKFCINFTKILTLYRNKKSTTLPTLRSFVIIWVPYTQMAIKDQIWQSL